MSQRFTTTDLTPAVPGTGAPVVEFPSPERLPEDVLFKMFDEASQEVTKCSAMRTASRVLYEHLATPVLADAYKAYWAAETPAQERAALDLITAIKAVTGAPDGGYAFWLGRDACSAGDLVRE